jgi:predicted neutral ceramidase superfamily lipid hydrolase
MKTINSIGLLISLLASPISWAGYTILLVPVFLSTPQWSRLMIASAFFLSIPFPLVLRVYNSSVLGAFVSGFAYTMPLVLMLIEKTRLFFQKNRLAA